MGSNEIQNILTRLAERQDLSHEEATRAFQILMNGGATPGQMGAFLMGLRQKGETVTEITAGAEVLRSKAATFTAPPGAIDTCGTGGDMQRTYNISTASAIVAAGCGVKVAKHGNRSVSSASGSSDVLSALEVKVDVSPEVSARALEQCNLCFLMAPNYHSAMRHVAPVRLELGLRTIFNLLGPLANPAKVTRQVVGVYDKKWVEPMAQVLMNLGAEHAWVVHGADGMDEITTTAETYVAELKNGRIHSFVLTPEAYGMERASPASLKGRDAEYNANALRELLSGRPGAYRDIVVFNAAAALVVAGKAATLEEGLAQAAHSIDSGDARRVLGQLSSITTGAA